MTDLGPSYTRGPLAALIRFCLEQKLVVTVVLIAFGMWGVLVAPFGWDIAGLPRDPVPVDAIPDIGENQQIVFTAWPGHSPEDIDDQISYPLTVALLGMPGVKAVRASSIFGFSTVYVIFDDKVEYYWSRSRILEQLSSLPRNTLPEGVAPTLGPDATALGQVFWYTLEGRSPDGTPTGGWDLHELRSIQDFTVRQQLAGVRGVSEVASIGGFVREYQIDVNPDAMRSTGVTLAQVVAAVRSSNLDVGARTIEINRAEYIVRGLGRIESIEDIEQTAVVAREGAPVFIRDIATVSLGPALRRGVLTKGGTEAVGGVVIVRHGENPMTTIERLKAEIAATAQGLPSKVLADGTLSRVTIVPFYDRTKLINETLGTLNRAISQQILVTVAVVLLLLFHLRTSLLIGAMLPAAVLMTFVGMKQFGVDANIVALSGIAIAVGSIVDMGIVLSENIVRRLDEADPDENTLDVVHRASCEVGGAVLTAVLTTVVGFLPVFTMEAAEGKLFRPLAYTKTFALIASIIIGLTVLPAAAHLLLGTRSKAGTTRRWIAGAAIVVGVIVGVLFHPVAGIAIAGMGVYQMIRPSMPTKAVHRIERGANVAAVVMVLAILAQVWEPLGPERSSLANGLFIALLFAVPLGGAWLLRLTYSRLLAWCLEHKLVSLVPPAAVIAWGMTVWLGFSAVWGWLPERVLAGPVATRMAEVLPGLGSEFMPPLDEGAFLYMPTTMPHASITEATDIVKSLDLAIMSVPEVVLAVGKIGRADTALDPAPISMVETIIEYQSEYITDTDGRRLTFEFDRKADQFTRDDQGELIPDPRGRPYRQWRDSIRSPDDIWKEIVVAAQIPGTTSAPKLQPIETRIVMLQSGFRAPMGIKVFGPDLETIDAFGLELERILKQVPSVAPAAVFADRVVGKPYIEIEIDREKIARYGVPIEAVQRVIEVAIGGKPLTQTIEGRERYPVRVRYPRELRDDPDAIGRILVPASGQTQIPLRELAEIKYRRGPQMIKSENTFLVAYVLFDKLPGYAEVEVVREAQAVIQSHIDSGDLVVPAGVSFKFAGAYENQVRAAERMRIVLPLALGVIFMILYLQFRRVATTIIIFSGVFVAWGGGFMMLWLYGQNWFLDADLMGANLHELFQVSPINLSVAVWVGFLALFGVATDNGVIMASRIHNSIDDHQPKSVAEIRAAVAEGAHLRLRAAVMTSATTILALLPVLSSSGRGSDIMIPMALPLFGGMVAAGLSVFVVPVLMCWVEELMLRFNATTDRA